MNTLSSDQVNQLTEADLNNLQVDTADFDTGSTTWSNNITTDEGMSAWEYWQNHYYPQVIERSYPVYIQERAQDKGKKAFEIIKELKDEDFVKLEKVGDFVDLMDKLIKLL